MTLEEARKAYNEICERYGITHSDCHERRADGKIKFVHITLDIKIEETNHGNKRSIGALQRK